MSETNLENRDTALAEDGVVVEPTAPAEPQIDAQGRAYATGKRKNAIARVWIKPGSGVITVRNLRRIAKDLGEDVDDDELIAMIDEFDQNGDGVIDEKEFLAIMSKGADAGLVED